MSFKYSDMSRGIFVSELKKLPISDSGGGGVSEFLWGNKLVYFAENRWRTNTNGVRIYMVNTVCRRNIGDGGRGEG